MLPQRNEPYQYSFSAKRVVNVVNGKPALVLVLAPRSVREWQNRYQETRAELIERAETVQREFQFGSHQFDLIVGRRFGFDECMLVASVGDYGRVALVMDLPQIEYQGDPCLFCGGAGIIDDENCFRCTGGFNYNINHKPAQAISATLSILLRRLAYQIDRVEPDFTGHPKQLAMVLAHASIEASGGSVSGYYSRALVSWLFHAGPNREFPSVIAAMRAAYRHMMPSQPGNSSNFRAFTSSPGWLNIECPGINGTFLHPEDFDLLPDRGYRFSSHNVDSAWQQVVLLTGLGALTDLAQEAGL